MQQLFADLHIHSLHSDSDLSLEAIFSQARQEKLRCISITDHDTVAGLGAAEQLSARYDVEFVSGIELSSRDKNTEVHILGYRIDWHSPQLAAELDAVQRQRHERMLRMIAKLKRLGLAVSADDFFSSLDDSVPTRFHLARYMVAQKCVTSVGEAFKEYLSPGKRGYVERPMHSVQAAIALIQKTGGLAYLAHPHLLADERQVGLFKDWGLNGIEVIYPSYSEKTTAYFEGLAKRFGLLRSGGSDAHGSYKTFTAIGKKRIPYEWVEDLKNA